VQKRVIFRATVDKEFKGPDFNHESEGPLPFIFNSQHPVIILGPSEEAGV
jgi:hypothetical protein